MFIECQTFYTPWTRPIWRILTVNKEKGSNFHSLPPSSFSPEIVDSWSSIPISSRRPRPPQSSSLKWGRTKRDSLQGCRLLGSQCNWGRGARHRLWGEICRPWSCPARCVNSIGCRTASLVFTSSDDYRSGSNVGVLVYKFSNPDASRGPISNHQNIIRKS